MCPLRDKTTPRLRTMAVTDVLYNPGWWGHSQRYLGTLVKASQTMWYLSWVFKGKQEFVLKAKINPLPMSKFNWRSQNWEHSGSVLAIPGPIDSPNCTWTLLCYASLLHHNAFWTLCTAERQYNLINNGTGSITSYVILRSYLTFGRFSAHIYKVKVFN